MGQQCVECIKQANQGTRQATGQFGGRLTGTPVVTYALVALCVLVYLAELGYSKTINYGQMVGGAFDPVLRAQVGVAVGDWYRLFTSAFLHETPGNGIGLTHIIFNMWALIFVCPALEQQLGRLRYTAVYMVSALGGSVLYYLAGPTNVEALGASGAIFGLFGAWFVLARRLRLDNRQIVVLIVLNLVISFAVPGIAWQAHVGGLVAGAVLTAAYAYAPRQRPQARALVQAGATVAIIVVLAVAVLVRDHQLAAVALG